MGAKEGSGAQGGQGDGGGTARRENGLYTPFFTAEELAALGEAAGNGGLAAEIELLRVKLRRALEAGEELSQVVAVVRTIVAAVKVQQALEGSAAKNLEETIGRVLDEINGELG